jgi:hypothetical protein
MCPRMNKVSFNGPNMMGLRSTKILSGPSRAGTDLDESLYFLIYYKISFFSMILILIESNCPFAYLKFRNKDFFTNLYLNYFLFIGNPQNSKYPKFLVSCWTRLVANHSFTQIFFDEHFGKCRSKVISPN